MEHRSGVTSTRRRTGLDGAIGHGLVDRLRDPDELGQSTEMVYVGHGPSEHLRHLKAIFEDLNSDARVLVKSVHRCLLNV